MIMNERCYHQDVITGAPDRQTRSPNKRPQVDFNPPTIFPLKMGLREFLSKKTTEQTSNFPSLT